jgi:hypothetical protein
MCSCGQHSNPCRVVEWEQEARATVLAARALVTVLVVAEEEEEEEGVAPCHIYGLQDCTARSRCKCCNP